MLVWFPTPSPLSIPGVKHWISFRHREYFTVTSGRITTVTDPVANITFDEVSSSGPTYDSTLETNKGGATFNQASTYLISNQAASYWNFLASDTVTHIFARWSPRASNTGNGTSAAHRGAILSIGNLVSGNRGAAFRYESQNKMGGFVNQGSSVQRSTRTTTTLTGSTWANSQWTLDSGNSTAANRLIYRVNNTLLTGNNNTQNASGAYVGDAQNTLHVGCNWTGTTRDSWLGGSVSEIVITNTSVTSSDLSQIYLWISR